VATNDVLPLKAFRRDAIANLKRFWGLGHQRPNFDGYIYSHHAAPPYSARIGAIYFLPFGNVWLASVCRVQRVAVKQNAESTKDGWISDSILSRLWTKVHEIFRPYRKPLVLSNALFLIVCVTFRSEDNYSSLSLEVVEKPSKCKSFCPIFGEGQPRRFYCSLLAQFTVHYLAKFGPVPFADLRLQSLAMN